MSSITDKVYIGKNAKSLDISPELSGYSKVHIDVTDDLFYEAGTDTGRTLVLTNPFATQQIADDLLKDLLGYQYQPLYTTDAQVDPAVELGDGVTVNGVYGGVYETENRFGYGFVSDISAPADKTIDNEYPYKSSADRQIKREFKDVRSELTVTNDRISAIVKEMTEDSEEIYSRMDINAESIATEVAQRKEQGNELSTKIEQTAETIKNEVVHKQDGDTKTFGWTMDVNSWTVHANSKKVLEVNKNGAYIDGEIRATKGIIGGFTIDKDSLQYNQQWTGSNSTGVYLGRSGIQCGSWDNGFRVDNNGNLYANNGYFRGNVQANMIDYGGSAGYFDGAGLVGGSVGSYELGSNSVTSGKIYPGSVGTSKVTSGINSSLGNGDYAYDVSTGSRTSSLIKASSFIFDGHTIGRSTINGTNVLTWV